MPGFRAWVPIRSRVLFHVKRLVRGGLRASVAYGLYGAGAWGVGRSELHGASGGRGAAARDQAFGGCGAAVAVSPAEL
ncbi:hypothetical protein GCM10010433_36850 [Streptomyces pulveraceus]